MFVYGYGAPQDFVQAHMWFTLAEATGFEPAGNNRAEAESLMTGEQLMKARNLAREWAPK